VGLCLQGKSLFSSKNHFFNPAIMGAILAEIPLIGTLFASPNYTYQL
jgi:hypothetical protein